MYFSYVRPLLEYGDVIWDNMSSDLVNKIEHINIEAARIVTGSTKLVSLNRLYQETGWESLKDRRYKHKIIHFHKMVYGITPQYLSDLVPPQNQDIHNHSTRQKCNIKQVKCRTDYYSNSFIPSTIKLWNELPDSIKQNPSLSNFKRYLNVNNPNRNN